MSEPWTGKTLFPILRPDPPKGFKWVEGRLTRIQKTSRPDSVWVEVWQSLSPKDKQKEILLWKEESEKRDAVREGIAKINTIDVDHYEKVLAEAKGKYGQSLEPTDCAKLPFKTSERLKSILACKLLLD